MTATYDCIATTTLGSTASTVTFSSISGSYTDLVLVITTKDSGTGANWTALQFNSDTGSNYSWTQLGGNGSTASSTRGTSTTNLRVGAISTTSFTPAIIHIMNYANTTTNKTAISRNSLADYPTSGSASAFVGLWRNTSAITSIDISVGGQDLSLIHI